MLRCILLSSFTSAILCTTAQNSKFLFINYTTAQGLPDNNNQSIIQNSRGFLSIGTTEGLSRFDGRNFKIFLWQKTTAL